MLTAAICSLDLSPCDYFLRRFLNVQEFYRGLSTTDKLSDFLRHEFALMPDTMTRQIPRTPKGAF